MPVPTDTLRNQQTLHYVFAVSAVLLLGSVAWLVVADYNRAWRGYQRQARLWETAMTQDALAQASNAQQQRQAGQLETQIDELEATLPHERILALEAELEALGRKKDPLLLPTAAIKGEIGPKIQQLERARLAGSDQVPQLQQELIDLQNRHGEKENQIADYDREIDKLSNQLDALYAQKTAIQKQVADLNRSRNTLQDKLAQVNPQGLAKISDKVRNAPLMDWFNPTEKVHQLVVPQIRTDLNFLTVETIDRCNTCHVNIDQPAYEEENLLLFAERQVASYQGQDVDSINHPAVLIPFWENAAALAGLEVGLDRLQNDALQAINQLRDTAVMPRINSPQELTDEFDRIALSEPGNNEISRATWYAPIGYYLAGVKQLLLGAIGQDSFDLLRGQYRYALIDQFNTHRAQAGLASLDASPVLLAHPRLDRFVDPESSHPMKTMGCTSCHEGSGQETHFHHAAHTPRAIWVDAQTGAPVPAFLLQAPSTHETHDVADAVPASTDAQARGFAGISLDGATVALASNTHGPVEHDASHTPARFSHDDVKITQPGHPAPFAPTQPPHQDTATYRTPVGDGQSRQAIRQAQYWNHAYSYHAVHFMEWEKPMHRLDYIESSCVKCHTEIFDVNLAAPKLFEGRLLFSQLGCVNCHAVESLKDDLDIKRVGPSLVHLKHKLTAPMISSWIWSPKAFRPTTKMPHYFMLENNSSPVDILRTRTEVAAITHYLLTAESADPNTPAYQPEAVPELTGDTAVGRRLFNSVGCKACHTNLAEQGRQWITQDLTQRQGLSEDDAKAQYQHMTYNQQHWYVMEHLPHKLERTGPELSGVGTKLKAGRDPQIAQQQATAWLYNWLRNPRHYSSYTIMPSFRLTEQEAQDMASYLLSLERPGYEPVDFLAMGDDQTKMLAELTATLKAAGGTMGIAREEVAQMQPEDQLAYLGKKMIGNYGCNNCHLINGFETATSACANLDDWGMKDPHKLDFGYFDHAFDAQREKPISIWKVDHEGVTANAPQVDHQNEAIQQQSLTWETMEGANRRPWLYHKLHNPRVYDRGRTAFEGSLAADGSFDVETSSLGRPYDKLKMPKFFLTDDQARALVTFVTSIRKPLVSSGLQVAAADDVRMRLIRGRQTATLYNCYGCHNIEGNAPHIWQSFDVWNENGSFNYEALNNTPPRLIGQGAKTQPQWLHGFLQNVHKLRPWLKVRMPSFPLTDHNTTALVDYFASASQEMSRGLAKWTEPIEKYRTDHPEDDRWFTHPSLALAVSHIQEFALMADLARPKEFDEQQTTPSEMAVVWERVITATRFQQTLNDVAYPYVSTPQAQPDEQAYARGQKLLGELRCVQCHAFGDEDKLFELWALDNPDAGTDELEDDSAGEDDGYEDDYGDDDYGDDEGYGDDDDEGYGDDQDTAAVPAGPVYTAPNLSYTTDRLQRKWVDAWLQEPATIQPGTKMPAWFSGGGSVFAKYPADMKQQKHDLYGYTGAEQRRFLLDFLYAAGRRNYTPGVERLLGSEPSTVELTPMPKPVVIEKAAKKTGDTEKKSAEAGSGTPSQQAAPQAVAPPPAPKEEPKVSAIKLHDEPTAALEDGGNGRVVGVVKFEGKPPRRKPIRMGADQFCTKAHKGTKVLTQSIVVNDDGALQYAFIYVKSGLSGSFAPPAQAAVINQVGCMYLPHVTGVMTGQPLLIINSDNTLHNVKMNSANNGSFNEGMPVPGMQLTKSLSKPELGVPLRCDVHPWMNAVLHVMDHPFFSVSDVEGRFEITGLPPGTYTLEAVHENKKITPTTFEVTITADTSHRVDVTLKR